MTDWVPLREFLANDIAEHLDDVILHDPDPELRALLARDREKIIERMTDQAELVTLRRMFAERAHVDAEVVSLTPPLRTVRVNGRGH